MKIISLNFIFALFCLVKITGATEHNRDFSDYFSADSTWRGVRQAVPRGCDLYSVDRIFPQEKGGHVFLTFPITSGYAMLLHQDDQSRDGTTIPRIFSQQSVRVFSTKGGNFYVIALCRSMLEHRINPYDQRQTFGVHVRSNGEKISDITVPAGLSDVWVTASGRGWYALAGTSENYLLRYGDREIPLDPSVKHSKFIAGSSETVLMLEVVKDNNGNTHSQIRLIDDGNLSNAVPIDVSPNIHHSAQVAFHPSGQFICIITPENVLKVFRSDSGKLDEISYSEEIPGPFTEKSYVNTNISHIAFAHDGSLVVARKHFRADDGSRTPASLTLFETEIRNGKPFFAENRSSNLNKGSIVEALAVSETAAVVSVYKLAANPPSDIFEFPLKVKD